MSLVAIISAGAAVTALLVFMTHISERQAHIDTLNRQLSTAQNDYDILRAQRAELRSPARLAERATELGMQPGDDIYIATVEPSDLATHIAGTGNLPLPEHASDDTRIAPLDQFRIVKQAAANSR